ncbi:DUF4382 domain-containing protein [Natrinema versiforme]|uniref:DUF4382 domain-containing protein n=1 Tax=Natrinema versiforme TaxID=88724 RepID=A0A4V1FXB9_9EURY|nr:DUF4382 domain-containing protein [Natrinema versiforme]QCS40920.1 DUF4382 domain-containing protein [Natrinema versiforme]
MNRRAIQLILVAALVAVAGCAGGMGGQPASESAGDDPSSVDDSSDGGMGTAAFYVSDEPNVIDDFEHLNVTITKVGFKKAGGSSETDGESDDADDGNETDDETDGEEDEADDGAANETDAEGEAQTDGDGENDSDGEETDEEDGDGKDEDGDDEKDGDKADGDGGDEWVEYDVDERTVDLTELKGANASMIDEFDLPAGDYEKVFIYVSDTEGVLNDGSTTRVKLPSSKLQLNSKFTVGDGERVDFVYDIAPHKAGKSGKYILKPVISESGTGDKVEIRDVDKKDENEGDDEDENRGNGGNGNGAPEADETDE